MAQILQEKKATRKEISHPRIDGRERVTGGAKYGADWKVPGMLYARILTSTIPHGTVKRIDSTKARGIQGVEAIITCLEDGTIWHAGDRDHPRRALPDRVRFIGESIAAVCATSRRIAQEAAQALEVEYDELPAVYSIDEAMKSKAPKIWEEGNVFGPTTKNFGDLQRSFDASDLILEADYETSRVSRAQLEPPVSLAWWEGDRLTIVLSTQTVHAARESIARDLDMPLEKVRAIALFKGGGFGGGGSTNYDVITALLAKKVGKPVMMEYSREQDFLGTHGRWSSIQHLRAAVSKSHAKLLAMELKAYCDIGAYVRFRPGLSFVDGPDTYYSWESWRAEVFGVHTNTPATGFTRAPAGPHSCFAVESFVDEIANSMGVNPLELKLRNVVAKVHGGEHLTSNGLEQCLRLGAEKFEWKDKWHTPPREVFDFHDDKLTGVGMAVATWHAMLGRGEAWVRITRDGILEVYVGVVDIGTGAKSTMAVIASNVLDVPIENVRVIYGDTSISPFARGEVGSMTTGFTGTAVREAALKLRQKIFELASVSLSAPVSDLRLSEGQVVARGGRKVTISNLIGRSGLDYLEEKVVTEPALPEHTERLSFAAHFAEVEVDTETGQVKVSKYVAAQDSGEVVNRLTAESQVQGSVIMGLGMALSEHLMVDLTSGSLNNASFLNYRLPNHTAIPKIEVIFAEVEDPYGPKSMGETSIVPVPAAIGNAIFNATGKRLRKLPFMPEDVLRAINPAIEHPITN